jgi:hypothetical protein
LAIAARRNLILKICLDQALETSRNNVFIGAPQVKSGGFVFELFMGSEDIFGEHSKAQYFEMNCNHRAEKLINRGTEPRNKVASEKIFHLLLGLMLEIFLQIRYINVETVWFTAGVDSLVKILLKSCTVSNLRPEKYYHFKLTPDEAIEMLPKLKRLKI